MSERNDNEIFLQQLSREGSPKVDASIARIRLGSHTRYGGRPYDVVARYRRDLYQMMLSDEAQDAGSGFELLAFGEDRNAEVGPSYLILIAKKTSPTLNIGTIHFNAPDFINPSNEPRSTIDCQ